MGDEGFWYVVLLLACFGLATLVVAAVKALLRVSDRGATAAVTSTPSTSTIRARLTPPAPRRLRWYNAKHVMEAEIDDLRDFIGRIADDVIPDANAELERELMAMTEQRVGLADDINTKTEFLNQLTAEAGQLRKIVVDLREDSILQEVGVYRYRHPMESADAYKDKLRSIKDQIRRLARDKNAVELDTTWQVNGNAKAGRRMVENVGRLLLRAYNNEADTLVSKMRPFKLDATIGRLDKSRSTINRLGKNPLGISITSEYHRTRVLELELHADWLEKKEEEKEELRALRERQREEEALRREAEAEKKRLAKLLAKEQAHYETVKAKIESGDASEEELENIDAVLADIRKSVDDVMRRAANVRAGHVYVISNIGSFGDRLVKIGMTRRLDPIDRIKELGDASVPFPFDVHAMIFSEDAVALEKELHVRFADRRVNLVNMRREFFYTTPSNVRQALSESGRMNVVTEFVEEPEAEQWHISENVRSERRQKDLAPDEMVV